MHLVIGRDVNTFSKDGQRQDIFTNLVIEADYSSRQYDTWVNKSR